MILEHVLGYINGYYNLINIKQGINAIEYILDIPKIYDYKYNTDFLQICYKNNFSIGKPCFKNNETLSYKNNILSHNNNIFKIVNKKNNKSNNNTILTLIK